MPQQIIYFVMISVVVLAVMGEDCERDKSRTVRKVVYQDLFPIYKELGVKIPYECPFLKEKDRYLNNEEHKERESVNRWSCNYCGKAFIGEIYLDSHFDSRHADTVYKEKDSVCLADFCEIFRCDVISGVSEANFWDIALCMEEDMQDLTQDCQELLEACVPEKLSWNVTNKLRSSLTNAVCSYLTCKKYWDTPEVPGDKEAPVAYTVFTVFLIVGMALYYCIAGNYFLTDTFADMYDSDEIVARNPEMFSNAEVNHNPSKKLKHHTRAKTFIDKEKFLAADKLHSNRKSLEAYGDSNARQRWEKNGTTYSKRRNLETNDDMFNIRSGRDSPGNRVSRGYVNRDSPGFVDADSIGYVHRDSPGFANMETNSFMNRKLDNVNKDSMVDDNRDSSGYAANRIDNTRHSENHRFDDLHEADNSQRSATAAVDKTIFIEDDLETSVKERDYR